MKLLSVSLLVVLAFAAGILFYRAAFEVPAPAITPTNFVPDHSSRFVLARNGDSVEPMALTDASLPTLELLQQHEPATFDVIAVGDQSEPGLEFNVTTPGQADVLIRDANSFDVQVADAQPGTLDVELADAPAEDPFELPVEQPVPQTYNVEIADGLADPGFELQVEPPQNPAAFDPEIAEPIVPPATTIEVIPDDSRPVRIDGGATVEADSVIIKNSPAVDPQQTAGGRSTTDTENPIPEFLRGQQLPPLIPGQKVVTIQVPVENWVDLGWGDIVRVDFDQGPIKAVGKDGSILTADNLTLQVVAEAEIYALPQFAPEHGDTVPVCLKLSTKDAKELLILRKNPGKYTLTVVRPHAAQAVTYESAPTPIGAHDDFAIPTRRPDPVPDDFGSTPPSTYEDAETPADSPDPGSDSGFRPPSPKTYSEPESRPSTDDLQQPETRRQPIEVPVPVDESSPRPEDDFDPQPVAESELQPRSSPDDTLDLDLPANESRLNLVGRDNWNNRTVVGLLQPGTFNPAGDESLPEIEPSEVGTVRTMETGLSLPAGSTLLVEDLNGGAISRVAGFDPHVIRVTALSRRQLKIEGLTPGVTMLTVTIPDIYQQPLRVPVDVTPAEATNGTTGTLDLELEPAVVDTRLDVTDVLAKALEPSSPQVTPSVYRLEPGMELSVSQGQALHIESPLRFTIIDGFDPAIISVTAATPRWLTIKGLQAGETTLVASFEGDEGSPVSVKIQVNQLDDLDVPTQPTEDPQVRMEKEEAQRRDEAEETLRSLYPEAKLELVWLRDSLLLRGTVASELEALQITEIAEQYAPKVHNQLSVATAEGTVQDGTEIPPYKRVVVIENLSEGVVQQLATGQHVNLARIRAVTRVVERDGHREEAVSKVVETVATDVTVFSVDLMRKSAGFLLTFEQVVALHSVPGNELQVIDQDDDGPAPRQTYVSENSEWQLRSSEDASHEEPEQSLRNEIRALHDDVRKLIALLEHQLSDHTHPDAHDHDHGDAEHPQTGSPSSEAEEPAIETEQPASEPAELPTESTTEFQRRLWDVVGVRLSPVRAASSDFRDTPYRGGLQVSEVRPESPVAGAGIRAGDVLVGLHIWETVDLQSLQYIFNQRAAWQDGPMKFYLLRGKDTLFGPLSIDWKSIPGESSTNPEPILRLSDESIVSASPLADRAELYQLNPNVTERQQFLSEWGRAMLQRRYELALALAEEYRAGHGDDEFSLEAAEAAHEANEKGKSTASLLVAAVSDWCAPCVRMKPLLQRVERDGLPLVLLDADKDAALLNQLEITAIPTLAWTIDGQKQSAAVGVLSETQLKEFIATRPDPGAEEAESADESATRVLPRPTPQSVEIRGVPDFRVYVGFTR